MSAANVDGKTVAHAYLNRIALSPDQVAHLVKRDGQYRPITWSEVHGRVLGIFASYQKFGIQKGDRVCIVSTSRSEWNICDLANLTSAVVTVPIYHSNIIEDVAYILKNSEPRLIFAEDQTQVEKLKAAFEITGQKLPIVVFDPISKIPEGLDVKSFSEFAPITHHAGTHEALRQIAESLTPESLATIVYTSGTTGRSKGAVLPHSAICAELRSVIQSFHLGYEDTTLSFLPMAHILGRVENLMAVFSGMKIAYAENLNTVPANIAEIRPTLLISVPRIFEKIYAKIQSEVASQPSFKQGIFKWAESVGRQVARLRSEKTPLPLKLMAKHAIADQLVLSKIRNKLGGQIRIAVSGGAPLSAELCEFFHACGVPIVEGYGLTETTAAVAVNRPDDFSFGTVGKPLGDTEFRIAADGEILVKSPMVFQEYYQDPESTKEVFTDGRWFRTGDIGEITNRGFLKITDRKKEIIVTSAGKNIAPQKIENLLKSHRFISQALVVGDKQKYIAALVTLQEAEISKWAKDNQLEFSSYEQLVKNPVVVSLIESEIKALNAHLASYETIKRIRIVPQDFTVENGELTPSLKVKRKIVSKKYQSFIDEMFS